MVFKRFGGFISDFYRQQIAGPIKGTKQVFVSGSLPIGPSGGAIGGALKLGGRAIRFTKGQVGKVLQPFTTGRPMARIGKALAFGQGFNLVSEATESRVTGEPFKPSLLGERGLATAVGFGLAGIPGGVLAGTTGLFAGATKRTVTAFERARGSFIETPMTPIPDPVIPLAIPEPNVFIENTFPGSPLPQTPSTSTIIQPSVSVGGGGGGIPQELIMLLLLGLAGGGGFLLGKKKKKKKRKKRKVKKKRR